MAQHKLSVVQVIDQLSIGGAENVLVTLSNVLSRHGHPVTVVTTVAQGPLAALLDKEVTIINIARKSKWGLTSMYRLYSIIKKYDVIHVHSSYNLRYLFLAAKLFFLHKPIFFHEHFGDIEIDRTVKWHHRLIYPKTFMICVSRKIYEWAAVNLKMNKNRLFILHNIVLKKQDLPPRKKKNDVIELLLVSNIRPTKNIEFAIEILYRLKQQKPCSLTIVGQKLDEAYYNALTALISKYGLTANVTMLHNVQDIQPVLHKYDLAIHTAKSESGPLVLIEYLAQNLPFVTYNTGETVFQIQDALPECIARSFNADEWLARIENILTAPADNLTQKLATLYIDKFSAEAYYSKCLDIYQKGISL